MNYNVTQAENTSRNYPAQEHGNKLADYLEHSVKYTREILLGNRPVYRVCFSKIELTAENKEFIREIIKLHPEIAAHKQLLAKYNNRSFSKVAVTPIIIDILRTGSYPYS